MNYKKDKAIILFDGICNLCNSTVNFILRQDKNQHFMFASLQSDAAKRILLHYAIKNAALNTLVLIENEKIYTKSTAVLRIIKRLHPFLKPFYLFIILPKFIRDAVYDLISNKRYRWFGKRNTCRFSDANYKNRFLL